MRIGFLNPNNPNRPRVHHEESCGRRPGDGLVHERAWYQRLPPCWSARLDLALGHPVRIESMSRRLFGLRTYSHLVQAYRKVHQTRSHLIAPHLIKRIMNVLLKHQSGFAGIRGKEVRVTAHWDLLVF